MSTSSEYKIESIVIALIKTGATFASVSVVHHDEDTAAGKDRITVKCDPKAPMIPGKNPAASTRVFQAEVLIEAHFATRTAATLETWATDIDALLQASPPGSIVSLATTHFPSGIMLDESERGARQEGSGAGRMREKMVRAIFRE